MLEHLIQTNTRNTRTRTVQVNLCQASWLNDKDVTFSKTDITLYQQNFYVPIYLIIMTFISPFVTVRVWTTVNLVSFPILSESK